MGVRILKLTKLERALEILRERAQRIAPEVEEIHVDGCVGRVLAEDLTASRDLPVYHKAALDGYATQLRFVSNASRSNPVRLKIVEKPGRDVWAVPVKMGAPIPEGADVVLRVERVKLDGDEIIYFHETRRWKNIDLSGAYYRAGEMVLQRGKILRPMDVAALSEFGVRKVRVYKRPRAAILSIGRELLKTCDRSIPNDYAYVVKELLELYGAEVSEVKIVADEVEEIASTVTKMAEVNELVVTLGRASVGKNDVVEKAYKSIPEAEPLFHGVTLHPGKPSGAVSLSGRALWLIFPGSIVSALTATLLFGKNSLRWILKISDPEPVIEARISESISPKPGASQLFLFNLEIEDGEIVAKPLPWGVDNLKVAVSAHAYILLNPGQRLEKGGRVLLKPITWSTY